MSVSTWQIEDVSDLLLLVLRANEAAGRSRLLGITRLQKLLFLITRDARYADLARRGEAPDIDFEPYKMGPFTPEIYEGIETLASFQPPLLNSSPETGGFDALETARYVDEVDLDSQEPRGGAAYRPQEYRLTQDGKRVANALWADAPVELQAAVSDVVAKFGKLPLRELLRRVYISHPDMTVRSEIRSSLGLG
jgi:hypothetical protein